MADALSPLTDAELDELEAKAKAAVVVAMLMADDQVVRLKTILLALIAEVREARKQAVAVHKEEKQE